MEHLLAKISIMLVPALLAVTLHEVAHGFIAEKFGDPTARMLGRLTLNPVKHLDPIGTIALLVFGFGWARPVPVNFSNLHNPKRDMIWVALAGPFTNFSVALVSAGLLHALSFVGTGGVADGSFLGMALDPLRLMVAFSLYVNIILGIFNLIPIPPLDGGRVMTGLLPSRQAQALEKVEPFGFIIIIFLIFFTDLWRVVLSPVISFCVVHLAGNQTFVVERVINFLLGH
jgi:Zn-dependent protease